MERLSDARLYGIVDLACVARGDAVAAATAMIAGGVEVLQLRAKALAKPAIAGMAAALLPVCRAGGVPFVVNDHPDVAASVGADGVHVGQEDSTVAVVRSCFAGFVGKSTHSPAQAKAAVAEGADYIGFGPLFATPTKPDYTPVGLEDVARVVSECSVPVFCIGGIKPENLDAVLASGARRVVLVSAILEAPDITGFCRALRRRLDASP